MKLCTNCGAQLSDTVKFCVSCGTQQAEPQALKFMVPFRGTAPIAFEAQICGKRH